MEKTCVKCGLPLNETNQCSCNTDLCAYCCECSQDCQCGCQEKKAE
ncbi:MAG TPA: hypothetical protein PKI61_02335 [bacterium]|nr:hypothetical protein [bacterium]HPT29996.1 hypothetical protein [bacterium]